MAGASRHGVSLHPRARVSGPDKGSTGHCRGAAHRRVRRHGPIRPLACRTPACRNQAARLRGRSGGRPPSPPPGERGCAQERDQEAAIAGQARRLHQLSRARLGDLHCRRRFRRRSRQAGARPRDTGGAAAARQDPQRRQPARTSSRKPATRRSDPGAGLRHRRRIIARKICATARSSS